ncbi:YtpI family protein [Bhargavaea cecembensis]|uniref:YtpI family protein n=1 Tax=Bhargavaea cecembensis TaxID=394098 RepID=UPI000590B44D|nr:YtpI family protein [Bhargavaea cecembensis]
MNIVLIALIVFSAIAYLYFKTKQFRTTLTAQRKYFSSSASAALGALLITFGANQLFLFRGAATYIISAIFILLGLYVFIFNMKARRHYAGFLEEERRLNEK